MYGLRNKSVIFKMRRPETRIGCHNTNDVILTKSPKVSRFHAVINFLSDMPLIRDISEWGVFLNNMPIGTNRWAELKLGDVLALGAPKIEDGGHLLEVVLLEPEEITLNTNSKIEIIDITEVEDDSDVEVICISDEVGSKAPKRTIVPSKVTKFADCAPRNSDASTQVDEIPLTDGNMIPSNEIKLAFVDVTSSMSSLLLHTPTKLQEKSLPSAFQSILNYSSGEECAVENSGTSKTSEMGKNQTQIGRNLNDDYAYKSPLDVFSGDYNNNDESSDSSVALKETPTKTRAPIIHRTLLTNKIARIEFTSPLPNKSIGKRRRRIRSESPDSIYQRVVNEERKTKLPKLIPPKPKDIPHEPRKALLRSLDQPNLKDASRGKISKKDVVNLAREKIKALYFGLPVRTEKTTPSIRVQPKIKITDKNRGDFLTKLEPATVPRRNLTKPHNEPENYDNVTSNHSLTKAAEKLKTDRFSNEAPWSSTARQIETKLRSVSSHKSVKSINKLLDSIDVPKDNVVPIRRSERTVEVCINFSKPSIFGNSKTINGGSTLKEAESPVEKEEVRFSSKISTTSEDPKIKCLGPGNCFGCGENCVSSELQQKERFVETCYTCFRDGHTAKECRRPMMCYNCKKFGHKGNHCPLPDIRKAKQISRDPRIKDRNLRKASRWDKY